MQNKFIVFFLILFFSLACTTNRQNDNKTSVNENQAFPNPDDEFAGSLACRDCHINIYNRYMETLHALSIRKTNQGLGIVADSDFDGINDFEQGIALGDTTNVPKNDIDFTLYWYNRVTPRLLYTDADYLVKIEEKSYPIEYTIGGNNLWKQLYLTKINNLFFILPIQYNEKTNMWILYDSSNWFRGTTTPLTPNTNSSWEKNCSGCHVTGLVYAGKNAANENTAIYKELNIGCEACHGSGKKHIETNGEKETIINPSKLTSNKSNDICNSCHSIGKSLPNKLLSFPYNDSLNIAFKVGNNLKNFFEFDDNINWGDKSHSSKYSNAQSNEFRFNKHSTCFVCHEAHGSEYKHSLRRNPDDNSLCLNSNCHSTNIAIDGGLSGIIAKGDISGHTKHKVDKNYPSKPENNDGGSKCINCHMPSTGTSAILGDIANHSFNILYPAETNLLGNSRPNSCMNRNCHSNRDNSTNKWQSSIEVENNKATEAINNSWGNLAPIANANLNQEANLYSTCFLDGSKSFDPNDTTNPYNDNLNYKWIQKEGPSDVLLNNSNTQNAYFIPNFPGEYIFELEVSDGILNSKKLDLKVKVKG